MTDKTLIQIINEMTPEQIKCTRLLLMDAAIPRIFKQFFPTDCSLEDRLCWCSDVIEKLEKIMPDFQAELETLLKKHSNSFTIIPPHIMASYLFECKRAAETVEMRLENEREDDV